MGKPSRDAKLTVNKGTALTAPTTSPAFLDAKRLPTLPEENVAHCRVDVVVDRVSTVDHQAIHKLHGLGPLATELPGHHHLAALGSALHDETKDTVTGPKWGGGERNKRKR